MTWWEVLKIVLLPLAISIALPAAYVLVALGGPHIFASAAALVDARHPPIG